MLSRKHYTEPVSDSDKVMSRRHLKHRAEVERMKNGPKKKYASRFYNLSHAKEHLLSLGSMGKKLAKLVVKQQKKSGLMSLASMKKDDSDDS